MLLNVLKTASLRLPPLAVVMQRLFNMPSDDSHQWRSQLRNVIIKQCASAIQQTSHVDVTSKKNLLLYIMLKACSNDHRNDRVC